VKYSSKEKEWCFACGAFVVWRVRRSGIRHQYHAVPASDARRRVVAEVDSAFAFHGLHPVAEGVQEKTKT
jgi:hypothetical protein